jgi:hypothetical protein
LKKKTITRLLASLWIATFLLGIHEGRIALWRGDDPEPVRVFPYSVATLPKEEQQRLQDGIRIESMAELQRLLEAYLS